MSAIDRFDYIVSGLFGTSYKTGKSRDTPDLSIPKRSYVTSNTVLSEEEEDENHEAKEDICNKTVKNKNSKLKQKNS